MSKNKPTQVSLIQAAPNAALTIKTPVKNEYDEYQKYLKKIREAEEEYRRLNSIICANDPSQVGTITRRISSTNSPVTQAVKADDGKRNWDLLPMDAVEEIVKVLEFGSKKYSANNWRTGNGFSWKRVLNSSRRHLYAFIKGEDNDPETGLSHIAHLGCNVLFLLYFILNKERYNQDDRNVGT